MAVANKIFSNGSRVLQKRNSAQNVIFNDADIMMNITINTIVANRPITNDLIINFNTPIDWICGNFRIGDNANIIKKVENTSVIRKSTKINDDNNGAGNGNNFESFLNNSIFIPTNQLPLITKLTISQDSGGTVNGIQNYKLIINSVFPNLIYLESKILQYPDFLFLESLPTIKSLDFYTSVHDVSNLSYLKNSNVEFFRFIRYNPSVNMTFINNLPLKLYYLQVTQCNNLVVDLKDIFKGNIIGFSAVGNQALLTVSYSGGAVFQSSITPRHTAIDYILYIGDIPNKLSNNDASRFIVDFANQVVSCTLPTSQRIIRLLGVTPNTSYTDNSQPLFKTYASALNHITSTLGITVTFT